jgi:ABC-type sugar transport system permease subunit
MFVLATVPQIMLALGLGRPAGPQPAHAYVLAARILLPTVTSVAAVGIIFAMIFSRDTGVINFLLEQVGRERPHQLEGRQVVVVAGDLDDGRLALDRLQRTDPAGRAAGRSA